MKHEHINIEHGTKWGLQSTGNGNLKGTSPRGCNCKLSLLRGKPYTIHYLGASPRQGNLGEEFSMWDYRTIQLFLWGTKISYNAHIRLTCVSWHVRSICYLNSMCFLHAFLIALIKKNICIFHMFKWHMLFLYVGCKKFLSFCDGCIFAFILLKCNICEQANTRKIQKNLLLTIAKKKRKKNRFKPHHFQDTYYNISRLPYFPTSI
jgi:hypothetical protein